jgi:hypothetical protein
MIDERRGAAAPHFFAADPVIRAIVRVVAALGAVCVVAGGAIALYAAWLVFVLIDNPKSIPWLSSLVDQGVDYLQAARGTVDGRAFDIELGQQIYLMGLLVIGVLLLWALAGLAKVLISAGVTLLGPALRSRNGPP